MMWIHHDDNKYYYQWITEKRKYGMKTNRKMRKQNLKTIETFQDC